MINIAANEMPARFDLLVREAIEATRNAPRREINRVFADAFGALGFDRFTVLRLPRHGARGGLRLLDGVVDLALSEAMDAEGLARHDPAMREVASARGALFHSDLPARRALQPLEERMLAACQSWGVNEGYVQAERFPDRDAMVVYLTSPHTALNDATTREAAAALSTSYALLMDAFHPPAAPLVLTDRQMDCLRWARDGHSAKEIGKLTGLSDRTVEDHFAKACARLGVRNRTQAVAQALLLGLITD